MTGEINNLRQLLCEKPTPELKSKVCAMCMDDMMWDMAENVIPGLKEWADRQYEIAVNLEKHSRRYDEGEDYYECRFKIKNLEGADLSGAELIRANLIRANLHGANLHGANLRSAYLYGADLYGADLSDADLYGANLRSAYLYGANLYGADLSDADLYGADLSDVNLRLVKYNADTQFPEGFSLSERGMVEVKG